MTAGRQQQIEQLLLNLLPADGSTVGNAKLFEQVHAASKATSLRCSEDDFASAREALVEMGLALKGRGRGGSTARATASVAAAEADRPSFQLDGGVVSADLPLEKRKPSSKPGTRRSAPASGEPQVLSYRHADKRKNNPEVGLVSEASDPEQPKTTWAYDPHLDPVLQFDSARSRTESLIDAALASGNADAMRTALEELKRQSDPYLQWAGKAERTSFEVDTVSLHVHERVDPMSILAAVSKGRQDKNAKSGSGEPHGAGDGTLRYRGVQPGLFEAPFESLPLRDAVDFYRHDKGWSNRLIAGDSLLVMNSLLVKEGMAGQVQMIYIDPPYGIKYGSNFQPFVNNRDVKDRADADLTQEPEMIKAFRDTWELGIHSYLTYLRDRLLLARDLLSDTGSVFVQIGDENVHLARSLLDDLFGAHGFKSFITVKKTAGLGTGDFVNVADYVLWYVKNPARARVNALYRQQDFSNDPNYVWSFDDLGKRVRVGGARELQPQGSLFRHQIFLAAGLTPSCVYPIEFNGFTYSPTAGRSWSTNVAGAGRLINARRLLLNGATLNYVRFATDFGVVPLNNVWEDGASGVGMEKVYVVQTNTKIVERCLLMTTDPGELVLDPTCGSGTTAVVAEKWGRRWITCDTSRVAVTLAKTRLMTASYDYFELRYPHEGLKGGFIYKTVPHVTLKSIANNPEIDSIYERLHPAIESALSALNAALRKHEPAELFTVTEGVRKGEKLKLGSKGTDLYEWEVPYPADDGAPPEGWPAALGELFNAFQTARQRMQAEMDRSIAAHADSETLYDQPEKARNKLRITGPFSVEAVPFPTVLSLDEADAPSGTEFTADAAVARSGATSRHAQWRDELLKTGIRGRGGQILKFTALDTLAGTVCLHCSGTLSTGENGGEPAVVSFGPEHGALEQRQVEHAIGEAGELFPRPKFIVFCAFAFDPEAAKDIDAFKGITALKAQMNTDLLTEDLKKARASNQSFWLMGQPDVLLKPLEEGRFQVEVNGFDYFDTARGELVSGGKAKIAMWSLDTDYDGRSLFPHQVFFPMAGKGEGWEKLKKDIRAELDDAKLKAYQGTVSLPFTPGPNRRVAVKIVDDRGIESLKVLALALASD
jgi:adenine-specific DNA-methyltransferase